MDWQRNRTTGHYYAAPDGGTSGLLYMIKREPYGKNTFMFTAYVSSPLQPDAAWRRIPLAFSSRLKDVKAKAEKHCSENKL